MGGSAVVLLSTRRVGGAKRPEPKTAGRTPSGSGPEGVLALRWSHQPYPAWRPDAPFASPESQQTLKWTWRQPYRGLAVLYIRSVYSMTYTWDRKKSATNLRRRGFDFLFATLVFDGPRIAKEDSRRDYGERRIITIGKADGVTLTVVYTDRLDAEGQTERRIISARKSNRREREVYEKPVGL